MMTGIANLPLHNGRCPRWLFPRMVSMGAVISEMIIEEYGDEEFLKRLSDPYWLQALGCVIGFDWHSSGLTTTTLGALKEGLRKKDIGVKIAGGKGIAGRKTPDEIKKFGNEMGLDVESLIYASKMVSKVDSCAIQDGYQIYHHSFIFSEKGKWCVVQQGLNKENKYARRYHWFYTENFILEPHTAICCDIRHEKTLDMTSKRSEDARSISIDIVKDVSDFNAFIKRQTSLNEFEKGIKKLSMRAMHTFRLNKKSIESLKKAHDISPENYEELLSIEGMGPKTIRALSLISEIVYGAEQSWEDPAKFSFAHGGKDGIPYPVDRKLMDKNIEILNKIIQDAKLGEKERYFALKRLNEFIMN